jgi:hypothetical protein
MRSILQRLSLLVNRLFHSSKKDVPLQRGSTVRISQAEKPSVVELSSNTSLRKPLIVAGRECEICEMTLADREALIRHYQQQHDVPSPGRVGGVNGIGCPECSYEFETVGDEVLHYVATHK